MSFFNLKKIIGKLTNTPDDDDSQDTSRLEELLKDADPDYKFAQLFTHSGGFFNYCGDEANAVQTLKKIVDIEGIRSVFCWDENLMSFLDYVKANHSAELQLTNDAAFITCEYLIAFDGRIMLSHNNILHYSSSRLPEKIIIMANMSQIVTNLNDAMALIRRRGPVKNLTSISGNQSKLGSESNNSKLFLLLLED